MKISFNWLNTYLPHGLQADKLAEILTAIGLETESLEEFESIQGGLKGIVIGKILSCKKHPNADKLSVCEVDVGKEDNLKIVCGAPNVATGQTVPVATPGTMLYAGEEVFCIKRTKLRGEVSEGMICAEDEIGVGNSHDGIMVLPDHLKAGTPASEYFDIEKDTVINIDLTPNRIDAASHIGVARDLKAYLNTHGNTLSLKTPSVENLPKADKTLPAKIIIEDTEACPRYSGCTISGITVKESPVWLQNRLKAIGLNPVNNIVDIGNFVLHETGHPLHTFDYDKITGGKIIIKKLEEGKEFISLDEEKRKLNAQDLMICNEKEPMCIAGVFGGIDSGITGTTRNIFIESAFFDPVHIRKTAKRHGLNTDASFRFERGADPEMCLYALKRAALLITEIAGGSLSSEIMDLYPAPLKAFDVELRYKHMDSILGKHIPSDEVLKILSEFDMEIVRTDADTVHVRVPRYRFDVRREADLIEEVLRIYGYNHIPPAAKLNTSLNIHEASDAEYFSEKLSSYLAGKGFNEIMSNSLSNAAYYHNISDIDAEQLVPLANPISRELGIMRYEMLFSGLEAIRHNINHKTPDLKIFEIGKVYKRRCDAKEKDVRQYDEKRLLGIWLTGLYYPLRWNRKEAQSDFYHLKGHVEALMEKSGILPDRQEKNKEDIFEYGMDYYCGNEYLYTIGRVKTKLLEEDWDIAQAVYHARIDFDNMGRMYHAHKPAFKDLPRFPEVNRDLALLIDKNVSFSAIRDLAFATEKKYLKRIDLFDVYEGKNIDSGKKSYAISLSLQDESKTMKDKQINKIMNSLIRKFEKELGAQIR